jgi:hypothetical protein
MRDARGPASLIALLLLALGGALGAGGSSKLPPAAHPYPASFPDGPGHLIAERACAICHSPMLITQQAKDSAGWEKSLTTMEKWGAPVSGADHDTLRAYLLSHFGPKGK